MSLKRDLRFYLIKFCRYVLQVSYMRIFEGHLKGYTWSTTTNYDYLLGTYEDPHTLDQFLSWLKPDSIFYDIGANAGYYTLIAEQKISSGMIYSFEPMPDNIKALNMHIRLNEHLLANSKISVHSIAISDAAGEKEFSDDKLTAEGNTYVNSSERFHKAKKTITVKADSVDGLVNKGLALPDILKIDVEGAELDVLKGAAESIKMNKPYILLATHDCHVPGIKDKCIKLLQSLGYSLHNTGTYNKHSPGHDDFIAIHPQKEMQ